MSRKSRFWHLLRPRRVRAGVHVGVVHAEAEWERPKARQRPRRTRTIQPTIVVTSPPTPIERKPEDIDPLDRLLAGAQDHFVTKSLKSIKRSQYEDALVEGAFGVGIHRMRKRATR